MRRLLIACIMAALLPALRETLSAQEFGIRNYGIREGLCHAFVYTVSQDKTGYIWLGTGEGICRFNGLEFDNPVYQDSLASEVAAVSYTDSEGTIWFGYHSGNIASYDGTRFRIMKAGPDVPGAITGFAETDEHKLLFSTLNNGIYHLDAQDDTAYRAEGLGEAMYTALLVSGKWLLAGTQGGLYVYESSSENGAYRQRYFTDELELTRINDIQQAGGQNAFWVATEDLGLFRITPGENEIILTAVKGPYDLTGENLQSVYEDRDGQIWLSTLHNGVIRLDAPDASGQFAGFSVYNKDNGLSGNATKRVFQDLEGNIWIATYGEGLALLVGQAFTFFSFPDAEFGNDVKSLLIHNGQEIFIGGNTGLFTTGPGWDRPLKRVSAMPEDRITALHMYKDKLLIGTEQHGLYEMNPSTRRVSKINMQANSLGNSVNAIASDSLRVYLATQDGIYVLDNQMQQEAHYTTLEGLPHNNIEQVIVDGKQRLLFATRTNGIYQLTREGDAVNLYPTGKGEIRFRSIAEDGEGNLWAATDGDGVFFFSRDTFYHITDVSGLKSNYCYSLVAGNNQTMWVGHRLGVSRINTANLRIGIYDLNIGITGDFNQNATYGDPAGRLYFGTTEGVMCYDPERDKNATSPPISVITKVLISDKEYDVNQEISLPYRAYKLRIEFTGLHYSDPEAVTYQYMLEGHDLGWSDITTQNFASYPRIEDGEYTFYLRSFSGEGLSQEEPAWVKIKIRLPIWKTWWFISLAVLFLFAAVYVIIRVREHKQKELQQYLENELNARTREVVEQKEVIETKNRDITDSITYAKRIQTSMLPPIQRLQQYFSGCFVFYCPRDIVSGDFYWFDRVNENKFFVVCADSTGHGVPGAFMSMIGSTLIKDICMREAGHSPSQVLQALDRELKNTLNQNLEDGTKPSDGMDIIVCEIDLRTHYIRFATAMRPIIIYRNGEEVFIKGSRNSIGGHYEREDNVFVDEGLQLSRGDIIYMFSDGYADQFGGPMNKKFKMVRLKNMLQEIYQKPMDEQYNHIQSTFNSWKEHSTQVDDVLFMGIKI